MSDRQVVIYNDLSCDYPAVLWRLHRDRKRLRECGISMAGSSLDPFLGLPSHQQITWRLHHEAELDNYNRQLLADSLASLASLSDGNSLLLVTSCPWADALAGLHTSLGQLPDFSDARISILCNLSPQWALIEQKLRLARLQSERDALLQVWLRSDAMNLGQFLVNLQRGAGSANVYCVGAAGDTNSQDSPVFEQLASLLNVPLDKPKGIPLSVASLLSRNTRQIFGDIISLNNVWAKEMESRNLIRTLLKAEAALSDSDVPDFQPMLAPELAREIEAACVRGNAVAKAIFPGLSIPAGSADFRLKDNWRPWQGNPEKTLQAILETMPGESLLGMHETLAISHNRLDGEQRKLFGALNARLAGKPLRKVENQARVSVLVQTYNHEKYIAQALDSILAQKTDFGVEIVVLDDASSDGNREIIETYARKHRNIRPLFLRSRSKAGECNSALLNAARTPYVAVCDGDDYYTDPFKLQTQANFLDAHRECSLCFHPVRVIYEDGSPEHLYPAAETVERYGGRFSLSDLMGENFIQTNSVMYRWRFREGLPAWFDPTLLPNDWYWHLLHAETGEIRFINKPMSVYRRHAKSIFWRKDRKSSIGHRQRYGIKELRFYEKALAHFGAGFRDLLQIMANGVFSDFTTYYIESGDDSLLQKGLRYFPEFGKNFLRCVDTGNVKSD